MRGADCSVPLETSDNGAGELREYRRSTFRAHRRGRVLALTREARSDDHRATAGWDNGIWPRCSVAPHPRRVHGVEDTPRTSVFRGWSPRSLPPCAQGQRQPDPSTPPAPSHPSAEIARSIRKSRREQGDFLTGFAEWARNLVKTVRRFSIEPIGVKENSQGSAFVDSTNPFVGPGGVCRVSGHATSERRGRWRSPETWEHALDSALPRERLMDGDDPAASAVPSERASRW